MTQQQIPPPLNTYALLSLIISLAVFPPVGIWLGYQARKQIAHTGERGGELATAGIVVGWIFTSLYALFFIVWCGLTAMMLSGAFIRV